jgi:hypothetical protein
MIWGYPFVKVFASSPSFAREEIRDDFGDWINITTAEPAEGDPLADILSVDYYSDGRSLNSTVWLSSPLYPSSFGNINVSYVLLIDSDMNRGTGIEGADYKIEIKWDNRTKSWTREFIEWESIHPRIGHVEDRAISKITLDAKNYTGFSEIGNRYISLSTDLGAIGSPSQYRIIFYTSEKKSGLSLIKRLY